MYPISTLYADLLRRPDREFILKVEAGDDIYDNRDVVEFEIENSLTLGEEFELGTAVMSKLTIKLRLKGTVPANARIAPFVALSTSRITWKDGIYPWEDMNLPWEGGMTEWLPLGEFYVDSRQMNNKVWTLVCYDKLVWSDVAYVSSLTYPTTQQAVWDEICDRLGYAYDSSVVINPSYVMEVAPTGYSMRQVMSYIAAANVACVFVGKDGLIKFKRFSAAAAPVSDMGVSDYIRVKQTNPLKTYTRIVATYDDEEGLSYEAGEGSEGQTLYVDLPFATQAIVDDLHAALNGFSYVPIDMDARGFPHFEHGDVIGFQQYEGNAWEEMITSWDGALLPWNGLVGYQTIVLHQVMSYKGGLKMRIEAPAKSEQASEFSIDGSLTQQVNKLNQTAVKQGKPYFGVTITKEEGIVTERSDHASKLIINSDVLLDWYVGGSRKLYYDDTEDAIKFSGTIEASVITGGEINGTTITGGVINGTAINGGKITGALIQTSAAYPRSEMSVDGNYFGAFGSESENIRVTSYYTGRNRPVLSFTNNGYTVTLDHSSPGFFDITAQEISLDANVAIPFGQTLYITSWDKIITNESNLLSELNSKANIGSVTTAAGAHNHGIPNGTVLLTADGGTVTFIAASSHSHYQS
ncbi:hypothetical protein DFQ01_12177 [Paenibacillus cellulosilyticus]|uniref:Phage minor structural protein n=1 Tax=Paenibacillus cellulosilyticus TaxID=375489 RepID=A0A2V2YXU1_9BACL|nr:hypothetical protein [Paenibacillus cellulosilyticus]PWV97433.1 hypothetical protein DFQ01_12177 [Paenibacillus cellulosilyticus]QKS48528.1 hypothetical protein HUB94_30300 [Paenibacillus cellulosilyticus]